MGTDNETSVGFCPYCISSALLKRQTRRDSCIAIQWQSCHSKHPGAAYHTDDDLEPKGSLNCSIVAKDSAASSLAKGPASKDPSNTADRHRGRLSVAACRPKSVISTGVAGDRIIQWDVIEDEELPAAPRSTLKATGTLSLRCRGTGNTDKIKKILQEGPVVSETWTERGRELPAARPWNCPE